MASQWSLDDNHLHTYSVLDYKNGHRSKTANVSFSVVVSLLYYTLLPPVYRWLLECFFILNLSSERVSDSVEVVNKEATRLSK